MNYNFDINNIDAHYNMSKGGVSPAFQCPFCTGICAHNWNYALKSKLLLPIEEVDNLRWVIQATCQGCGESSYWTKTYFEETLLFPKQATNVPSPNSDMPENIKQIYREAALIINDSPRASAALSRLAIDLLTKEIESVGKTLNDRIGNLVKSGLPTRIQMGLDAIRVIGNNAIHPGEIDMSDNKDMALSLLKFLNIIVENQISQPKEIEEIYESLPEGTLAAIEKRDSK